MRRTRLATLLLAAALGVIIQGPPALAAEAILDWRSDITVEPSGSMVVSETIEVRAEGREIRRGIFRDFPTDYRDRAGNSVRVAFELLAVKRDGRPEPHHTERVSNGVRLYIGSRDVFLQPGDYTYQITYRTDRQLGFFDTHDELYWNVTGNGWIFPILKASAAVTLPGTVPADSVRTEAYTGLQGSREGAFHSEVDEAGRVVFETTRSLAPKEGLTIVVGWPKGHVAEPTGSQKARHFVADNRTVVIGLAGLVAVLLFYMWAWIRVGRDPERGTIIPRFEPPDGLSPAAARYIMEMGFDNRAFASAVINLAVKGYLTIVEGQKGLGLFRTFTLERTDQEPRAPLSRGEQKIARKLFPGNSMTLVLEKESHKRVSAAISALKDLLSTDHEKAHFLNNRGYFTAGLLLSVAVLVAAALEGSAGLPGGPPPIFVIMWLTPWTLGTFFLWRTRKIIMAVVFSFFLIMATIGFAVRTSLALVAVIIVLVAANLAFNALLKAPTRLGRRIMDRIEGFKMYMETAEEHRLEKLHPPEKTPELFEKYLPYALALEVDQQWSEKFADVLRRAAETEHYAPRWYRGRSWDSMHSGRFASSLGSSLGSAISSSSTAPGSSSGFGGGGGSGGGGGGGGGGGW